MRALRDLFSAPIASLPRCLLVLVRALRSPCLYSLERPRRSGPWSAPTYKASMRRIRSRRYVKRIYAALMISSLVCQLQVIVVSTVALERLSREYDKEVSVESFMRRYFDLEWIAVRLNFFVGVLSFVTAIGLRAWQASACVETKFRAPHAIDVTLSDP